MSQFAAVTVLDRIPDDDEIEELAMGHLEELESEEAEATVEILYAAPDWMSTCEQDQINAHMRDGGACVLVVYMNDNPAEIDSDEN